MIWIILTIVFGWLLCGAWALRMCEKDDDEVEKYWSPFYTFGLIALVIIWFSIWPERIGEFIENFKSAWKQAMKGKTQ